MFFSENAVIFAHNSRGSEDLLSSVSGGEQ